MQGKKLLTLASLIEKLGNLLEQQVDLPREKSEDSQVRRTFNKVVSIEKTQTGYISTMSQGFKRGGK